MCVCCLLINRSASVLNERKQCHIGIAQRPNGAVIRMINALHFQPSASACGQKVCVNMKCVTHTREATRSLRFVRILSCFSVTIVSAATCAAAAKIYFHVHNFVIANCHNNRFVARRKRSPPSIAAGNNCAARTPAHSLFPPSCHSFLLSCDGRKTNRFRFSALF